MQCCRSDWPWSFFVLLFLTLVCCQTTELIRVFFCFINFSILLPPPPPAPDPLMHLMASPCRVGKIRELRPQIKSPYRLRKTPWCRAWVLIASTTSRLIVWGGGCFNTSGGYIIRDSLRCEKKTEFLDKSSINIDIWPVFLEALERHGGGTKKRKNKKKKRKTIERKRKKRHGKVCEGGINNALLGLHSDPENDYIYR